MPDALSGRRVVVGVTGGIAAYKTCYLVRGLREAGADVHVVTTPTALEFVGRATWEALSGNPVRTSVLEDVETVAHVRLGQEADLVVVAPATADLLARARQGRADDLLTATLLVAACPVVLVPAMHTEMWHHPATVENVAVLRSRPRTHVLEPASGRLTGVDTGPGRLPEPAAILAACDAILGGADRGRDLDGVRLTVSAGGTREALDPVRHLANASSGRQGWAIAAAAAARGASVHLIAANVALETVPGADRTDVTSAAELATAMHEAAQSSDVVIMAAAVADFRPRAVATGKIKKADDGSSVPVLDLERTEDVLATLVKDRARRRGTDEPATALDVTDEPATALDVAGDDGAGDDVVGARTIGPAVIVGFAAETGDEHESALDHGRAKARRKGADLLAVNDVSGGSVFGGADNDVTVLDASGEILTRSSGTKTDVAHALLDAVRERLDRPAADPAT